MQPNDTPNLPPPAHNPQKVVLVVLIVVVVVAAATYGALAWRHNVNNKNQAMSHQRAYTKPVVVPVLAIPTNPPSPSVAMIFNKYGFEPNEYLVPVGTSINVSNASSLPLQFMALPGQIGNLPGLDIGMIGPGDTKTFLVSEAGSWQFEANNSPSLRGNITGVNEPITSWSGLTSAEMPKYDPSTKSLLINYTDFGFLPNMISVPVGTKVSVLNSTNEGGMDFEALNADPNLSLGILNMTQSRSFTLAHRGTWQYENTWESDDLGQITAQ